MCSRYFQRHLLNARHNWKTVLVQVALLTSQFLVSGQTPSTLPPTIPVVLGLYTSGFESSPTPWEWNVEHKFYKLSSVTMYADNRWVSGFQLTFSADSAVTTGWADIISPMFGYNDLGPLPPLAITEEITEVAACFDVELLMAFIDLERFKFIYDQSPSSEIGTDYFCDPGVPQNDNIVLSNRLIGFKVHTTGTGIAGRITSIAPIIDSENCEEASFEQNIVEMMTRINLGFDVTQDISNTLSHTTVWGEVCDFTKSLPSTLHVELSADENTLILKEQTVAAVHTISLDVTSDNYSTYIPQVTYTFDIHILEQYEGYGCKLEASQTSNFPTDQMYTIGDAALTTPAFTTSIICNSYCFGVKLNGAEVNPLQDFITLDQNTLEFTIQTSDLSYGTQIYDVDTCGSVSSFQLTLTNPCETTILDSLTVNNMEWNVYEGSLPQAITTPTDTTSFLYGDMSGTTFCGDRVYSITPALSWVTPILVGQSYSIEIESSDYSDASGVAQTLTLQVELQDYPLISKTAFFTVDMFCDVSTYDWSSFPTDTTFVIGTDLSPINIPYDLAQTPECYISEKIETITIAPTSFPVGITHDAVNKLISIWTIDDNDAGEYTFTINANLQDIDQRPSSQSSGPVSIDAPQKTFKITIITACDLVDVNPSSVASQSYILDPSLAQEIISFDSFTHSLPDCGAFDYVISPLSWGGSSVSVDTATRQITLDFSSSSELEFQVTLIGTLVDHTSRYDSLNFNVKVYRWSWNQVHQQTYSVGQSTPLTFTLEYDTSLEFSEGGCQSYACDWQCYLDRYIDLQAIFGPTNVVSAEIHYNNLGWSEERICYCCSYSQQVSATLVGGDPLPEFITFDSDTLEFNIISSSLDDVGLYDIDVIASFEPVLSTFLLNFSINVLDPCETATVFATVISDWESILIPEMRQSFGEFTTSEHIDCGLFGYTVTSSTPAIDQSWISVDAASNEVVIDLSQVSTELQFQITLNGALADYPSQSDSATFNAKLYLNEQQLPITEENVKVTEVVVTNSTELESITEVVVTNSTELESINLFILIPVQDIDNTDDIKPVAWTRKVSHLGVVTVIFSEYMFTPNFTAMAEQLRFDEKHRRYLKAENSTEYTNLQYFWFLYKDQLLEITVEEKYESTQSRNLDFDWIILDYVNEKLTLQLEFVDAAEVSSQNENDILTIKFLNANFFIDTNGNPIEEEATISCPLPSQLYHDAVSGILRKFIEIVEQGSKVTFSSNIIINFLVAGSLHQLWALINSQQIIVLFPLYRISMPANAGIYFNVLMQVAAFDFFETDDFYYELLDGQETSAYSPNFNVIGFDSMWFMNNMGSMGFILVLCPLLFKLRWLCRPCRKNLRVKKIRRHLKEYLYWSVPLRMMIETYMITALCCFINLQQLRWYSLWESMNATASVVVLVVLSNIPIVLSLLLKKYNDKLSTRETRQKYSTIYSEMRTNISGNGLIKYVSYYYIRRLVFALTVVMLGHVLVIQFFIFMMSSIFQVILVGFIEPYVMKRLNQNEIMNEICTIFIMYHIFCFTDWVPDAKVQYNLGYSCLFFNCLHLSFNLSQLAFYTLKAIINQLKEYLMRRKLKVQRWQNLQRINTKSYSIRKREWNQILSLEINTDLPKVAITEPSSQDQTSSLEFKSTLKQIRQKYSIPDQADNKDNSVLAEYNANIINIRKNYGLDHNNKIVKPMMKLPWNQEMGDTLVPSNDLDLADIGELKLSKPLKDEQKLVKGSMPDEIEWEEPETTLPRHDKAKPMQVNDGLTYAQKVKRNEDKFDRTIQKVLARDLSEDITMKLLNKAYDKQDKRSAKLEVENPMFKGVSESEIRRIQTEHRKIYEDM